MVGKSLDEEKLEEINSELLDQAIAEIKIDELKTVEDFQSYKEVDDVPSDSPTVDKGFLLIAWDRNCCSLKPHD